MSFKALSEAVVGLCNDVFGDDITYTPNGESAVVIKAVFNNAAYVDIEGVVSLKPILKIDLNDLDNAPAKGDRVAIEDVEYRVMESRPDGFGGSTLILQKA